MRFVLLLVFAVVAVVGVVAALQLSNNGSIDLPFHIALPGMPAAPPPPPAQVAAASPAIPAAPHPAIAAAAPHPAASKPMPAPPAAPVADNGASLAARIPAGLRAITIAIDAVSGNGVSPGDHVDVLFTHGAPPDAQKPAYSEVMIPNVQVLAVGAQPSSVTLQVNPWQAQQLSLAGKTGTLSLAQRSEKDYRNYAMPGPTAVSNLSRVQALAQNTAGGDAPAVTIIRGVGRQKEKGAHYVRVP